MSFHDVGCLSTEDRRAIIDIIIDIKNKEREEINKSSKHHSAPIEKPNFNMRGNAQKNFSSLNKDWSSPMPNIPKS